MEDLLEYLTLYGGKIVSTAHMEPMWIEQAKASGRLYVDEENRRGFVWEPDIKDFPTNETELDFLERWYPLPIDLPGEMNTIEYAKGIIERSKD